MCSHFCFGVLADFPQTELDPATYCHHITEFSVVGYLRVTPAGVWYNGSRMEPGRVAECVKNGRRILIVCTIIPLMLSSQPVPASSQIPQPKRVVLNQQDQTAIIRFILKQELSSKTKTRPVCLSTENIAPALSSGLTPANLIILSPQRILEWREKNRGKYYFQFSKFEVKKRTVRFSLVRGSWDAWDGLIYVCKSHPGRWTCREVGGFNRSS